ncbi:F0F1 ATP synthase subunit A [bacterium]|nr:F0F1 ATP synthase subunit A [bacterium]
MNEHHGPSTWLQKLPFLPHEDGYVHVNGALVVFAIITVLAILANRALKKRAEQQLVPDEKVSLINIMDAAIDGLRNMVVGTIGETGEKYFPFIATLFLFIFFSNFLGLLPFSAAPTASVSTTFALGIAAFVYYNVQGVREHGVVGYLKHFLMGLGPAGILIAVLEIVSQVVRPLSLGIRLYVNMFVDHTVVMSFQNLFAWLLPVPLLLFGVVVCTIQAFVFAVLTAVYVQMATEHEHEEGHHAH